MFGPGDEVVCVNDNEPPQSGSSLNHVIKGNHYTVTRVEMRPGGPVTHLGPFAVRAIMAYVFLAGVPSPKGIGFYAFRFRKVEKKKHTVEDSYKILDDIRKEVERVVPAPTKVPEKVK